MKRLARAGLALGVVIGAASAWAAASLTPASSQGDPCAESPGDSSSIEGAVVSPTSEYREDKVTTVGLRATGLRHRQTPVWNITRVQARILACAGQPLPDNSVQSRDFSGSDGSGRTYEWSSPPPPALDWNGRYAFELVVTASNGSKRTMVRPFIMDLPASPPANVKASVASDGTGVVVRWDKAKEPDVIGYLVEWTTSSDTSWSKGSTAEVKAKSASDPPPTTFSHAPGVGEWRYRVISLRPGTQQQGINASAPSSAATAKIEAPPETTQPDGSSGSGGSGSSGGSTTGSGSSASGSGTAVSTGGASSVGSGTSRATSGTAGTVDLSNFSRLLDQRRTPTTIQRRPIEPDAGFGETLPFQAGDEPAVAANASDDVDESGAQQFAQEVITDDGDRRRAMSFVAASLLFAVLGYGLRLVKREAELLDLEPAEPTTAVDAPAEPVDVPVEAVVAGAVADDDMAVGDAEPMPVMAVATKMPAPRPVAPSVAPGLDVPLPARRPRRARADGVGTSNARRASSRVPQGSAADRGSGPAPVRPRSRRARSGDRRTPVG
ncbi:MAG TPA: hypothetical protein VM345_05310 [Acidimicrobiales bacterium]|nr:hypothetical protein [Acidimicrobiales bacterium]